MSPLTVDIPDIDLLTVTTLLLSNIFCFVLILTFLTVAFTTILPWLGNKPVIVTVDALFVKVN